MKSLSAYFVATLLSGLTLGLFSQPAWSISERGGGEVVLCYHSSTLRDSIAHLLEIKFSERVDLHLSELSRKPELLDLVEAAEGHSPLISLTESMGFQDFLEAHALGLGELARFYIYDFQFLPVPMLPARAIDFNPRVKLPNNCLVAPIATQYFEEGFVLYNGPLLKLMDPIQIQALRIHEQAYRFQVHRTLEIMISRPPYSDYEMVGLTPEEKIKAVDAMLGRDRSLAFTSDWSRHFVGYVFTHKAFDEAGMVRFIKELEDSVGKSTPML